jgi:nitroimidazol reductase NimA-like FMN-containing flavoprotein (pyridoxamine 5'-phosphate oxidase superfamily)
MINKDQTLDKISKILNSQLFAVIATNGIQYPYCTLVGFATTEDYRELIFATIRETRKYENIDKESSVSLLIDSRTNHTIDIQEAIALTILGHAQEVNDNEYKKYQSLLLRKHPYLREFVIAPNCALIKVIIDKYIMVSNFQNVIELEIS